MTTTSTLWVRVPLSGGGEAVYELDRESAETPHYDSINPDGMLPLRDVATRYGAHIATKSAGAWYVETNTGKAPFAYQTGSPELISALESAIMA